MSDGFRITLQIKAKHADILDAARKVGGIRALAEHLGVQYHSVLKWACMNGFPPIGSPRSSIWGNESKVLEIEGKLMELTGKSLEELFPNALKEDGFLGLKKEFEFTQQVELKKLSRQPLAPISRIPS